MAPSSTIQTLRESIKKELAGLYPEREINSLTDILFRHRLDLMPHEFWARKHEILLKPDVEWFVEAVKKLRGGTPVQHITGETEFFGLVIKTGPQALVPRPETEELVQWILQEHAGEHCRILDVGTGTGCIALALARNIPEAEILATDIRQEILELATENARRLGLEIKFFLHDVRQETVPLEFSPVDLILSNPPYVPEIEKASMDINVRDHEPASALFVPDQDPLLFYRHLARLGRKVLRTGGWMYVEIHEKYGQELMEFFGAEGFREPELRQDINGKDRNLRVRMPG